MKKTIFRSIVITVGLLAFQPALLPLIAPQLSSAYAVDWRKEFDEVCGKTGIAESLSKEELRQLVARCDNLRPAIEKLEDSERKVFLRRLRQCRELLQFVLESKEKE